MASLKWVLAAVMIVAIVMSSTIIALEYSGVLNLNSNPLPGQTTPIPTQISVTPVPGSIPLTLNVPFYIFNGTLVSAGASCPQATLLRADKATIIGQSASGAAITVNLNPSDSGVAYLLVTPATAGTYGTLDSLIASSNGGIVTANEGLFLFQGQYYTMYKLNLGSLQQISTGVTTTVNLYGYQAATPALASLLNSTAIGTSSYGYATVTCYFSGFATAPAGEGYKITRMQVYVNTSLTGNTNATAIDNGEFVLKQATINFGNGDTMITQNINWGGISTGIYEIGAPSSTYLCGTVINQQASAKPVLVSQSDSPSGTMTINLQWYGKQVGTDNLGGGTAASMWLKIFYLTPTGTPGTATQAISVS